MPVAQLSLWDNEALERGYHCLADLELDKAVRYFNNALQAGLGGEETTREVIEACLYWQLRIKDINEINALDATNLLSDYEQYPFTRLMKGLKRSLLGYIVDCILNQTDLNWDETEIAFDLLLDVKDYQKAENFISVLLNRNREKWYLLYFLAQAQWLDGNTSSANDNYILALLRYPENAFIERIENKKVQSVTNSYGPAMAPAYCFLLGIVPFVPIENNIEIRDNEHAKAIRCLHLLREADKALKNNDLKSSINFRKQLKAENPGLYEIYFNVLKKQK